MARRQLADLVGCDVRPVRDRIVVEDAGQRCRIQHRAQVGPRLAPVAAIDVRWQHHEAVRSCGGQITGQCHRVRGRVGRDTRHDRDPAVGRPHARPDDVHALRRRQRGRFTERAKRDDAGAPGADEPIHMLAKGVRIDRQPFIERSRDRGNHTAPVARPHQAATSGMPHSKRVVSCESKHSVSGDPRVSLNVWHDVVTTLREPAGEDACR